MGRYIDWSDVTNRYRDVAKSWDAQTINGTLIGAEDEVDARLAPRYAVPFSPGSGNAPGIVRSLCVDLTYWKLIWAEERAKVLKDYLDDLFKALVSGSMSLVTSAGLVTQNLPEAWTDINHRSTFGPDSPLNWRQSEGWMDDARSERVGD